MSSTVAPEPDASYLKEHVAVTNIDTGWPGPTNNLENDANFVECFANFAAARLLSEQYGQPTEDRLGMLATDLLDTCYEAITYLAGE